MRVCEPTNIETIGTEDHINQDLLNGVRSLLSGPLVGQLDSSRISEEHRFPGLMELRTYDDFFEKAVTCPQEASSRMQARFNALRRHGNCRTRRAVILRLERYDQACDLTASEWEALLKPLLYNSNLEELYILACTSIDSPEVKDKIYSILGELLRTSKTLKFMFLEMGGLSAANVARLARGVQGTGESSLEALIIIDRPQAEAMKYLWEMIESAPQLRHLWLKRIGTLDDAAVNDWSEALWRSASLAKLTLEGLEIEGVSELLTKAFSEAIRGPNLSVKELELIEIDGAPGGWKKFFNFLRPNTKLTSLGLSDCNFLDADELFRNLMDLLQVNFTMRKFENDSIFSWKKDGKEAAIHELLDRNANHTQQSTVTQGT